MNWRELKDAPAGERFKRQYRAGRASGKRAITRALTILGGALLAALGVFMLVAPGPGIVVLALGAALAAQESERMARFLDWAELRIRSVISKLRKSV